MPLAQRVSGRPEEFSVPPFAIRRSFDYALCAGQAVSEIGKCAVERREENSPGKTNRREGRESTGDLILAAQPCATKRNGASLDSRRSRSFFRNQGRRRLSYPRSHNLHRMPVVWKFFAAIETRNIGSGELSRRVAPRAGTHRNWETVASVAAAKHRVHYL
jgi:hypothetical protein